MKPGLFKNELLGGVDPLITILFEGLWCSADREGRLEDRPLRLCAEVFPYRRSVTEKKVDRWLSWLHDQGFIVRYEVEKKRYIQVIEFARHQSPHVNERPSIIPTLTHKKHRADHQPSTGAAPCEHSESTKALRSDSGLLTPDSGLLTPDSRDLHPAEPARRENAGGEKTMTGDAVAPAAVIAVRLWELQVKVTSDHPTLLQWIADGITLDQLLNAVQIARTTKTTGWIPANYLDQVVRDPRPTSKANGASRAQQRNDQNRSAVQDWLDDDAAGVAQ